MALWYGVGGGTPGIRSIRSRSLPNYTGEFCTGNAVSPCSLDNAKDLVEGFCEVVVIRLAVRTDEASAVVTEGLWKLGVGPDHLQSALVARQTGGTAESRGKNVVGIHRSKHQHRTIPSRLAAATVQFCTVGAAHA